MTVVHDSDSKSTQDELSAVSRRLAQKLSSRETKQVQKHEEQEVMVNKPATKTPWLIEQYLDGDIDLDAELSQRLPMMPLLSIIHFRETGRKHPRSVASLSTQDSAAALVIEVDVATSAIQFSFIHSAMLSLNFQPEGLSNKDRAEWLKHVRLRDKAPGFLWGQLRWETDYLISFAHKYYTTFYAFSPNNISAAARITPEATQKLVRWLDDLWSTDKTISSKTKLW